MNVLAVLFMVVTMIFAPHPDDETTLIPLAQDTGASIVIVTNGDATGHCSPELGGPGKRTPECVRLRETATEGFVHEVAPDNPLYFAGLEDGKLSVASAQATIDYYCAPRKNRSFWVDWGNEPPECDIWFAGAAEPEGYTHPDHLALRDAVVTSGGRVWDGVPYKDQLVWDAAHRWYGWLLTDYQWPLIGLELP